MRASSLARAVAITTLCVGWLWSCASTPHAAPPAGEAGAALAAEDPCAAGNAQSPIVIDPKTARPSDLEAPSFHYEPTGIVLWNTGKTLQVDYAAGTSAPGSQGNYLLLDGVRFDLVEFHFHHPIEHPITGAGTKPVLELHLVHADARGNLAVAGVQIVVGSTSTRGLDALMAAIPRGKGWRALLPVPFDASVLAPPSTATAYRYPGSLTSPAYRECVRWNVYTQPLSISRASYETYKSRFPAPYSRSPQDLNGRTVFEARP